MKEFKGALNSGWKVELDINCDPDPFKPSTQLKLSAFNNQKLNQFERR